MRSRVVRFGNDVSTTTRQFSWERRHPACKRAAGREEFLPKHCSRCALIAGKMPALPAKLAPRGGNDLTSPMTVTRS